jgi:hypothetical protein
MVGWDGIEPPTPGDFQTRPHLPARTDDLSIFVKIRGFCCAESSLRFRSERIEAHVSVRVEFESSREARYASVL